MDYLMVIDNLTGAGLIMPLADAANLTHIGPEDIEQSIATFGACTSIDHTIVDTEAAEDFSAA